MKPVESRPKGGTLGGKSDFWDFFLECGFAAVGAVASGFAACPGALPRGALPREAGALHKVSKKWKKHTSVDVAVVAVRGGAGS